MKYEYETKTQEEDANNAVNIGLKYDTSMQRTATWNKESHWNQHI